MKVLIHLFKNQLKPVGGPNGVGYNLYKELSNRDISDIEFLNEDKINTNRSKRNQVFEWIKSYFQLFIFPPQKDKYNYNNYSIIHFHSTKDLFYNRKILNKYKGKVILTSHSPIPLGQEMYADIISKYQWFKSKILKSKLEEMDKFAFMYADYIIFPCEEAEEPYFNNWVDYKFIHELKKDNYRYVLTGIDPISIKTDRIKIREELNISDESFIVSFVGRHNEIKGYDKLKEIAQYLLSNANDIYFVICGKEFPLKGIKHKRWIEIGWTNDAQSYVGASDVFVLPNKETYFDLVMLEVLSIGKIVIASKTGGNKYFEKECVKGVFLYTTTDEAIDLINKIKLMSKSEREYYEKANLDFFNQHLDVSIYLNNYISTLREIDK